MTKFICKVKADSHKISNNNINFFTECTNVPRPYSRNTFHVTFLHNKIIQVCDTLNIIKNVILFTSKS